jgi:diguanylate cyclase (GGDEF)-like protein/PAS domain S-box-containing protein
MKNTLKKDHYNKALLQWFDELAGQGIFMTDAQLTIMSWNSWLELQTDQPAKAMIGRNLFDAFPELITRNIDKFYQQALEGQVIFLSHMFHKYLLPMQSLVEETSLPYMQQRARIAPLMDEGKVIGTVTFIEDVTERVEKEKALLRDIKLNKAIAYLSRAILELNTIEDISRLFLEHAKDLTGSTFGYIGYIDQNTGYFVSPLFNEETTDNMQGGSEKIVFKELTGFWGWVLENKESVLKNKPLEEPLSLGASAHEISIERFLSSPAIIRNKLVGLIALANPDRDYTEDDIDLIERLSALYAIAVYRSRIEDDLKKERDTAKQYLTIAEVIFMVIDTNHKVTLINKKGCEILGYPEDEIIGKDWLNHFIPDRVRNDVKKIFNLCFSGDKKDFIQYFENPIRNIKGDERLIAWHNSLLRDTAGNISGILSSGEDITERKMLESQIIQAKEDWERTFDSVPDFIAVIDKEYRIKQVNKSLADRLGKTPEEIIGSQCFELLHGTEQPPEFCPHAKLLSDAKTHSIEIHDDRLGGDFVLSVTPLCGPDGNITGAVHIAHDITDRKQVEEAMRSLSLLDELTGLYNRRGFLTIAEQQIKVCERNMKDLLLLFADMDGLKLINDNLGHQVGDMALVDTAQILKRTFRSSDILARFSGDEFIVLITELKDTNTSVYAKRLENNLRIFNETENRPYKVSISTGIVRYNPKNPSSIYELISRADKLMYQFKHSKYPDEFSLKQDILGDR